MMGSDYLSHASTTGVDYLPFFITIKGVNLVQDAATYLAVGDDQGTRDSKCLYPKKHGHSFSGFGSQANGSRVGHLIIHLRPAAEQTLIILQPVGDKLMLNLHGALCCKGSR